MSKEEESSVHPQTYSIPRCPKSMQKRFRAKIRFHMIGLIQAQSFDNTHIMPNTQNLAITFSLIDGSLFVAVLGCNQNESVRRRTTSYKKLQIP